MGAIKRLMIEIQEDCDNCGGLGYLMVPDEEVGYMSISCEVCSRKTQDLLASLATDSELESGDIDWIALSLLDEPDPSEPQGWEPDEEIHP